MCQGAAIVLHFLSLVIVHIDSFKKTKWLLATQDDVKALFYLFTDLLVGTKQRKFSWHPDRRRWRSTFPYPLSHPTWWSSSPIFMRTTRPPPRHCSVPAAVPLCPPTLECVATVVRMSISATSAGKTLVSFTGLKCDTHVDSIFKPLWSSSLRSINYDEKDPFLCNACGFCKYARFDFMLYAKPCCAVDPIENEEDRKKVSIHLLERTWKRKKSKGALLF